MIREDRMSLQTPVPPSAPAEIPHSPTIQNRGKTPRVRAGDILACGFGMTVTAWVAAYITRLPMFPAPAPGQLTISLMLGMVFVGGLLAARYSENGIRTAIAAGALSGMLDILIVGSVFHDLAKGSSVAPIAGLWIGGSMLLNALVAGAGGFLGMLVPARNRDAIRWNVVFTVVLACATLSLISAGGLVTAFGAGMAVPDWPQSYGYNMFLFPLSKMQSADGKFYEHAHSLMGSLVGLTSLTVAIYLTRVARRRWIKALAWSIFAGVCIQGLMGGFRVTENSIPLATIHGIFAQLLFGSMACLAIAGMNVVPRAEADAASARADRFLSSALLLSMIVQLTLGALVRQRVDVLVLVHIMMAAVVTLLALTCGFRAAVLHGGVKLIQRTGIAILLLVGLQLVLGILALTLRTPTGMERTPVSAIWTTAHQANGALLLAACATLWMCHWLQAGSAGVANPNIPAAVGPSAG
jgi:cytochrome c oxidase assembly protein subunit 15